MKTVRFAWSGALLAGWASLATWCDAALGQGGWKAARLAPVASEAAPSGSRSPESYTRTDQPADPDVIQTQAVQRTARPWAPYRRPASLRLAQASGVESEAGPSADQVETIPTPTPLGTKRRPTPSARDDISFEPLPETVDEYESGAIGGAGCDGCGECDSCGGCDEPGCDDECTCGFHQHCVVGLLRSFSFFAGVQGFKGPVDRGRNGNFGFHEGFNFGAPLGDPWCVGYQLGVQAVQSNFSGYQVDAGDSHGRDQVFFTGGLFHRALRGGLQGGVVFDFMHDNYYNQADLKQIRSETSLVFGGCHEIGYWGAYGVSRDRLRLRDQTLDLLQPNDIFAGFYRRRFSGGGQGRFWGGATGNGEGIIGAELTVPLGTSWALENSFTYLIPKNGMAGGGQQEESWSVSLQLVWYPGRPAARALQDPYQPLFGVGDNATFMIRR